LAVAPPFTIVQLTDPHIGAAWIEDPEGALAAAVDAVHSVLPAGPNAVIVTGDIANTPAEAEYVRARSLLDELRAPLYVQPGNHDDRAGLQRHFDLPDGELLQYAVELGPVRLVALDTKRDGSDGGQLDSGRLEWLERTLAEDRTTPTLIALHHPPLLTGIAPMDAIGIPPADRHALAELVSRHESVQLITGGHTHRTLVGALGHAPVLSLGSTARQLKLDFDASEMSFVDEPPCFGVHVLIDGRLVSHVQPVQAA
jgi:3',5'-cyclic AMP phosphodiesterase CpdA